MDLYDRTDTTDNAAGRAKSIMVLDGDEDSRMALEESLDELGHRTQLFPCLRALEIPEFDFVEFDLVICDLDEVPELWKCLLDRIRTQRLDTQLVLTSRKSPNENGWRLFS